MLSVPAGAKKLETRKVSQHAQKHRNKKPTSVRTSRVPACLSVCACVSANLRWTSVHPQTSVPIRRKKHAQARHSRFPSHTRKRDGKAPPVGEGSTFDPRGTSRTRKRTEPRRECPKSLRPRASARHTPESARNQESIPHE